MSSEHTKSAVQKSVKLFLVLALMYHQIPRDPMAFEPPVPLTGATMVQPLARWATVT
jgi:hypothetical protein